jgi:hypothetical protein
MFEIVTETTILAPPAVVWDVLTSVARYPDWNPLVVRFEGELRPGARAKITLAIDGRRLPKIPVVVKTVDANAELAWSGGPRVVLHGTHSFRLSDAGSGRTRFVHGERFVGALSNVLPLVKRKAQASYEALNEALKAEAECRNSANHAGVEQAG